MAYRMTKEELDEQFEQFLKESVSDDSVELGNSSKPPSVLDQLGKVPQKQVKKSHVSVPWWQDDDNSEEALEKDKADKCRFIKGKNIQAVGTQEESRPRQSASPAPTKPTPKPRSKALDRAGLLDKIHLPDQETSQNTDRQKSSKHFTKPNSQSSIVYSCSEERSASEDFLMESSSPFTPENSRSTPRQSSVILTESDSAPEESSDSDSNSGVLAPGKTFRKSLRKSQTIQEVDEEKWKESRGDAVIFSRDSLEPNDSLMASGSPHHSTKLSLDEEDEKARFFADLDKGTTSLSDDPRLNQQQESSSSAVTSPQREEAVFLSKQDQREDGDIASAKDNSASPVYSEDFEDETSEKEFKEKKPERRGMLAKVSLHDSLNSTDGALVPVLETNVPGRTEWPCSKTTEAVGPSATGQSYGQSGASEIEALQEAYRQISHSVGGCEEVKLQEPSRSPASPATPECSKGTFRNVSTGESDLPTAEELMRAIGPDSGFTYDLSLQPLSEAEIDANAEVTDGNPMRAKAEDSVGELRVEDRESPLTIEPHSTSPHNRYRSIAEEVKKLMQEQEDSQTRPSVSSAGKRRQQALGKSSTTTRSSSACRKAPVPSGRTKRAEIRPLPKASAPSWTANIAKPPTPLAQKKSPVTNKASALSLTHTIKGPDSDVRVSSEALIASVQSFTAFLQHQMNSLSTVGPDCSDGNPHQATESRSDKGNMIKDIPVINQDLPSERSSLERLRLQLAQKERQLLLREEQLQQEHSKEINVLRQENYLLQSKLHSLEEASKKQRWSSADLVTEEKFGQIEKEIKEQETLIQGYHVENEKLYMQMKALQAQSKQNEEAMFTENQRLLSELAVTKEQLNRISKQKTGGFVATTDQGCSVTELIAQVQAAQKRESQLQEEARRLKQEKQALQVDLQIMKKERDLAKAQMIYTSGDKNFELKLTDERHKAEVSELKKRLQWYAENQELLDKDAARLKAANAETQRLTEQVEKLRMEVTKRASQQEKKVKERAGEAKRIQDLERQVKEMEEILRRRHPNSLPALIYAAAAAGGDMERSSHQPVAPQPSKTATLLERRIQRLETELEGRDEEAKRSLRAMEQQFHRIKLQYEHQISVLEQQLTEGTPGHQGGLSQESETQTELIHEKPEQLKEAHQSKVNTLKAEVASLHEQLRQARCSAESEKPSRSPSRHQQQAEAAQANRIERLTQELSAKSRTIQELHRTVERLQRERRTMLSAPRVDGSNPKPKQYHPGPPKDAFPVPTETFPPTQDEKDYQPKAFSGSHISEVQQENDSLRIRQEQLEAQWQQERVLLQAAAAEACNELQRVQERNLDQLASLKAEHQREMEHLVARHAREHSSSQVAELTNQLKMKEIMVLHMREQLKELQSTKDALAVSKVREMTLQNQLAKLLEELKQAKEAHTPELKHFTSLEQKILSMELRYNQREQELQQMIAQTRSVVEQEQQAEVARWKRLAQERSSELDAFRLELDSILDVLRELQRQGVVIPATQHSSATGFVFRPVRS